MKYDPFFRALPKELAPLYLFVGEDAVRVEEGIRRLSAHAAKLWGGDPETVWLDAEDKQVLAPLADRLTEILGGASLFSAGRIAVVRRALTGLVALEEFLGVWSRSAPPRTLLLLWLESSRAGIPGESVEFPRMYGSPPPWKSGAGSGESELALWLSAHARNRYVKQLAPAAAQFLIETVGESPDLLAREVGTLSAYVGPKPAIVEADIEALVGQRRTAAAWALTRPLSRLDRKEAADVLRDLFENGMEGRDGRLETSERTVAILVASALAGFVVECARAAEACAGRAPGPQVLSEVGIHFRRRQEEVLSILRQRPLAPLERWVEILTDLDRDLKRDRGPARERVETALAEMFQAVRTGTAAVA